MLAAGRELIAPGKLGAVEPAARDEFPFGLGRQLLADPRGVSQRVRKCHMHDRMIVEPVDVALRTVGWRQSAPFRNVHHWLQSRRSTWRDGGENTSEPA